MSSCPKNFSDKRKEWNWVVKCACKRSEVLNSGWVSFDLLFRMFSHEIIRLSPFNEHIFPALKEIVNSDHLSKMLIKYIQPNS